LADFSQEGQVRIGPFFVQVEAARQAQWRVVSGQVDDALVAELRRLTEVFDDFAGTGDPALLGEPERHAAECVEDRGRALARLRRRAEADRVLTEAIRRWTALDNWLAVDRCRDHVTELRLTASGPPIRASGARFAELHRAVEGARPQSVARAEALLALALAYNEIGEGYDAFHFAVDVVRELDAAAGDKVGAGSGDAVIDALRTLNENAAVGPADSALFNGLLDGIRSSATIHQLYATALTLMARRYLEEDPRTAAAYVARARELRNDTMDLHDYIDHVRRTYGGMLPPGLPGRLALDLIDLIAKHRLARPDTDLDELADGLETIADLARRLTNYSLGFRALIDAARIRAGQGRLDDALSAVRRAADLVDAEADPDLDATVHCALAEIHAYQGRWDDVAHHCARGVETVEAHRGSISGPFLRTAFLRDTVRLYQLGALAAHTMGDHAGAVRYGDRSKRRGVPAGPRTRDDDLTAVGLSRRLADLSIKLDHAVTRTRREPIADLLAQRRSAWDQLVALTGRTRPGNEPPGLDAVQRSLEPATAVLYYYWLDRHLLLVLAIEREGVTGTTVVLQPAQVAGLERLTTTIGDRSRAGQGESELAEIAAVLLPDRIHAVVDRSERVVICPHKLLHRVPFHALPVRGDVLLRGAAISYAADLSALATAVQPKGRIAVFGALADDGRHAALEVTEQAVGEVAERYRGRDWRVEYLAGDDCTREQLLALSAAGRLDEAKVVHLAMHGDDALSENPYESALFLADRSVSAVELSQLRIGAELVVLSACDSADRAIRPRRLSGPQTDSDLLPGDDRFGLTAAILAAGGQQVVSTLWKLDEQYAAAVLTAFHDGYLSGLPADLALRKAMLSEGVDAGRPIHVWAPLVLITNRRVVAAPMTTGRC
jgi:CHAT domain-containing protein